MAQLVKRLLCKHETRVQVPSTPAQLHASVTPVSETGRRLGIADLPVQLNA